MYSKLISRWGILYEKIVVNSSFVNRKRDLSIESEVDEPLSDNQLVLSESKICNLAVLKIINSSINDGTGF
jgi:hypothetical protein